MYTRNRVLFSIAQCLNEELSKCDGATSERATLMSLMENLSQPGVGIPSPLLEQQFSLLNVPMAFCPVMLPTCPNLYQHCYWQV